VTWRRLALVAALVGALGACSDDAGDDPAPASSPTSTPPAESSTTTVADDAALEPSLVTVDDLPAGFVPDADVNDTITAFCAGQDAAAGLQASGRAIVGFSRDPAGASVIHLVLRFEPADAAAFVTAAEDLLTSCSDIPDATGLAFTYEAVSAQVAATLGDTEASASRYGVSVGAGNLTVNIGVFQAGEEAHLIAVLGLDESREDLDDLAKQTFEAAVARSR
jgi:hypothetical protein